MSTMKATGLAIAGAWVFEPRVFPDDRGRFAAPYQADAFHEALGFDLHVAQVNQSLSARGVIRGVHFADVPPGQAKYVYCTHGALLDAVGADASRITPVADRLGHDRRYSVDWSKINTELGYAPQVPFETGLAQTVRWYTENRAWWEPLKAGAVLR